jgi:hypothetical protein
MAHRNNHRSPSTPRSDQAAIFVDYDNLHDILRAQSSRGGSASGYALEILDEVRRYLEEGDDTPTIIARAYADYTRLPERDGLDIQDRLYEAGVEPVYASSATQSNGSELSLAVDAATLCAARADVGTIVLITGDRPYVPLVRKIQNSGRRALVAAVNPPAPDATPSFGEEDAYLDARNLLSQSSRDDLMGGGSRGRDRRRADRSRESASRSQRQSSPPPRRYREITNPVARRTVAITEEHFGQYKEVYLTPLLRKLSDVLGEEHDPKSLVSELEAAGAVRLEKRDGYPYDYTVLIMNEDHPDVQEIQDDYYSQQTGYGDGHADESYDESYDEYEDSYDEESDYDDASYDDDAYEDDAYAEEARDDYDDYDDYPSDADEAADEYEEETVDDDVK